MKQSKFRAWDKNEKKWLFDYHNLGGFSLIVEVMSFGELAKFPLGYYQHIVFTEYIGLKDKFDKEIYEGDFLIDKEIDDEGNEIVSYFPVVYNNDTACFCVDTSFYKNHSFLVPITKYFGKNIEVDGNIFDNSGRLPKKISFLDEITREKYLKIV